MKTTKIKDFPEVKKWTAGLGKGTIPNYLSVLRKFCKFVGKDPSAIIAQRKAELKSSDDDIRHRLDDKVMEFCLAEAKRTSKGSAATWMRTLNSFFTANRAPLELERQETRKITKRAKPVYNDYIPTREDLKAMCRVASLRDRAVLLTLASTGISGDVCYLKRQNFEDRWGKEDPPFCLAPRGGWLYRRKTKVKIRPFLTRDAADAIADYLRTRKDQAPQLFVASGGKPLDPDNLDLIVKRTAKRGGVVIPEGQRIRMHVFRSFFRTNCSDADIPDAWECVMSGRLPTGSGGRFYDKASEEKLKEKFKRVEPKLGISHITNMVLERRRHQIALDDQAKEMLGLILQMAGPERFKQISEYYLSIQARIPWDPTQDYEPAPYRVQRLMREMLKEISGQDMG